MTDFKTAAADFIRSELVGKKVVDDAGDHPWFGSYRELTDEDRIEVTAFDFQYNEGYRYSSWTYEDASFEVVVTFKLNDEDSTRQHTLYQDQAATMGTFLTGLLAHEDAA